MTLDKYDNVCVPHQRSDLSERVPNALVGSELFSDVSAAGAGRYFNKYIDTPCRF